MHAALIFMNFTSPAPLSSAGAACRAVQARLPSKLRAGASVATSTFGYVYDPRKGSKKGEGLALPADRMMRACRQLNGLSPAVPHPHPPGPDLRPVYRSDHLTPHPIPPHRRVLLDLQPLLPQGRMQEAVQRRRQGLPRCVLRSGRPLVGLHVSVDGTAWLSHSRLLASRCTQVTAPVCRCEPPGSCLPACLPARMVFSTSICPALRHFFTMSAGSDCHLLLC